MDTFLLPTRAAAPTWMRWLPRQLPDDWFTRKDGVLAAAEQALAEAPSLETAQTFMSAALTVGKDVLLLDGDYAAKVDVLRFAAVKLWDWSRQNGFERGGPSWRPIRVVACRRGGGRSTSRTSCWRQKTRAWAQPTLRFSICTAAGRNRAGRWPSAAACP